jgi:hypothetical protein
VAFPQTPLPVTVELLLGATWTDISPYVRARDGIRISRGQRSEGSVADPSSLTLTLDNRDGRFSPRKPDGPYYGLIGRNTPIRVRVAGTGTRLLTVPTHSIVASCPDSAGLSIVGDIDVRVDLSTASWPGLANMSIAAKYVSPSQRSWFFTTTTTGALQFYWSEDGTNLLSVISKPLPQRSGRQAIRATLDVDNGVGGYTVTYYTAPTIAGTWTQLGDAVSGVGGATSIFDTTSTVAIAAPNCDVYGLQVLQGIGGTARANPDFTAQTSGATSFADAAGNTWTVANGGLLSNRRYRFWGEVSAWPQKWDPSGADAYVTVEAAGVLRRLGQGASPLHSTLYQGVRALPDLVAYWPAEDAAGSTSLGSAVGGPPMQWAGTPTLATASPFTASEPLPTLGNSEWRGVVPTHQSVNEFQVRFVMNIPAGGTTNGAVICQLQTSGTIRYWQLTYGVGGSLALRGLDASAAEVFTSGPVAFAVDGKPLRVSIEASQSGADVAWRFATLELGAVGGGYTAGTKTFAVVGRVYEVAFDVDRNMDDVVIGHVSVEAAQTSLFDVEDQLNAYAGETASARIVRLCGEQGVSVRIAGAQSTSTAMGGQRAMTLVDLLRECEATDGGVLFEARDGLALKYRQRDALYNRQSAVVLDYANREIVELEPTDDDQQTRNDVTVQRVGGSSARAVLGTGPLSVLAPPDGVGRYETSVSVNTATDGVLGDHASWRLHVGTVDEPRYPRIAVQLASPKWSAADRDTVMDIDVGEMLAVEGQPAWLPPDDITQGVVGYAESLDTFSYHTAAVCVPASPYAVYAYDSGGRWSPEVPSTLNSSVTTTGTSLSVLTSVLPLWTTDAAEFPLSIVVGGEQMLVTAIAGASSPQTFTVVRSTNGVVKAHSAGAELRLDNPIVYAL